MSRSADVDPIIHESRGGRAFLTQARFCQQLKSVRIPENAHHTGSIHQIDQIPYEDGRGVKSLIEFVDPLNLSRQQIDAGDHAVVGRNKDISFGCKRARGAGQIIEHLPDNLLRSNVNSGQSCRVIGHQHVSPRKGR